jgi:pimeloyl-ACP methyl ester carboxylesterase
VTRTCAYDRAGFGRSEAGPLPRTASRIAGALDVLLTAADVPPPWVLVGHSYGGLVLRLLAARQRDKVAGMVLIEPATPEDWIQPNDDMRALIARGTRLCRYGTMAARSRVAVLVAALVRLGALAPARALVALVSRGGLRRQDEEILAPIGSSRPRRARSCPRPGPSRASSRRSAARSRRSPRARARRSTKTSPASTTSRSPSSPRNQRIRIA